MKTHRLRSWMTRHPIWAGVLALELLVLLAGLWGLRRPLTSFTLSGADFAAAQLQIPVTVTDTGIAIDTADPEGMATYEEMAAANAADENDVGVGVFLWNGPALTRGRYAFSIDYTCSGVTAAAAAGTETAETEKEIAYALEQSAAGTLRVELPDVQSTGYDLKLQPGQTHAEGHFWVQGRYTASSLMVYARDPSLTVSAVTVREVFGWRVVLLVKDLLLFALADLLALALSPASPWLPDPKRRAVLAGLVGLTVLVCLPAFSDFAGHGPDTHFHYSRIWNIAQALADGQFPVRLYTGELNGYGYGSPLFYGELLLYLPALLVLAGFPLYQALNALLILLGALTVGIGWFSFRRMFGRRLPAFVTTALYATASYRFSDIYWRHGIGEGIALCFLPLLAYGFWALYADDAPPRSRELAWLPLMLGFTGLIQSHTISTEIMAQAAVVLVLLCWRRAFRPRNLLILAKGAGLTVLLNLWFLLPFLTTLFGGAWRGTETQNRDLNASLVSFGYLFRLWDEDLSTSALKIGGGLVLGALAYLTVRVLCPAAVRRARQIGTPAAVLGALGVYLVGWMDWDGLYSLLGDRVAAVLCNIQFPFRYLMVVSLCFAAMGGAAVLVLQGAGRRQAAALGACCLLGLAGWLGWMEAGQYAFGYYGRNRMAEGRELISGKDNSNLEYLPAQFEEAWVEDTNIHPVNGAVLLDSTRQDNTFTVTAAGSGAGDSSLELPLIAYPGYRITANDGGTLSLGATATGKVAVVLAADYSGTFTVSWAEPRSWRAAELVSLVTAAALAVYGLRRRAASRN